MKMSTNKPTFGTVFFEIANVIFQKKKKKKKSKFSTFVTFILFVVATKNPLFFIRRKYQPKE